MNRPPENRSRSLGRILAIPAALFALSLFGLIASLLGDGWPDVVFAMAAGSGIFALLWSLLRRRT